LKGVVMGFSFRKDQAMVPPCAFATTHWPVNT
jgi:hypothetical protein